MINPVLCITRQAVEDQLDFAIRGNRAYPFKMSNIEDKHYHFLNRTVADTKDPSLLVAAKQLPQVLPYIVVTCGDEILSYSRAKGQEDRLHGSLSLGFGGHVDITDIDFEHFSLNKGIMRELTEELRLDVSKPFDFQDQNLILIDETNEVGQVHLGVVYSVELVSKTSIDPDLNEIHLPEWKTLEEVMAEKSRYENWSQSIADDLQLLAM